jgi:hypothetical protein
MICITASLCSALKRFRLATASRRLWAGAICINQDDNTEKSIQVRLMSRIYGWARRVLVYLGDEADESDLTFDILEEALKYMSSVHLCNSGWKEKQNVKPIAAIMARPWWYRVEEFVNVKEALIVAGLKEKPCNPFFDAVEYLFYRVIQGGTGLNGTMALRSLHTARRKATISLLDLLDLFQYTKARRARDHLFALLPLADDASDEVFDPDYEEPLESIVRRYAAAFVEHGKFKVLDGVYYEALVYYIG